MQITMKKHEIDLTCANLGEKCFEPIIMLYKKKVSYQTDIAKIKEEFYEELSEGQRALFIYYVYYSHVSKSLIEFYWWSAYFMAQPKSWSALKSGLKYFMDEPMQLLIENIELELKQRHYPETLESFTVTREQLEQDRELYESFSSLYSIFGQSAPVTIRKINNCIASNLNEFVFIED